MAFRCCSVTGRRGCFGLYGLVLVLIGSSICPSWVSGATEKKTAVQPGSTHDVTSAEDLSRSITYRFNELGASHPMQLGGIDGTDTLGFGLRRDEWVASARLHLRYTYSPSLLADLSHLKVFLNEEIIAIVPLPKERAATEQTREIEIDPRYLSDFNLLKLQLIGHYTLECEDAQHSSIWASISNRSELAFELQPIAVPNDLALLPAPFFDMHDHRRLELPFVFGANPALATLRSAGLVASWFGSFVGYREARFHGVIDQLPRQNAVVLSTVDNPPKGLELPRVDGPTIAIVPHPATPEYKLLLLLGRDASEVDRAADALVQGQAALSGPSARVAKVVYPPRRKAYDAPKWLPSDRPARFGELIEYPEALQVKSHTPKLIQLKIVMPPDLMVWQNDGIPMNLKFRYTPPVATDSSTLNVAVNHEFIRSLRLRPELHYTDHEELALPLRDDRKPFDETEIAIPAFQVSGENLLQFQFSFDYHKQGLCRSSRLDNIRASIDPDSTLDLSKFFHYTELPNLALFIQTGFPFTKYADLAETTVVFPEQPTLVDIETLLTVLGYMGRSTGLPALRYRLVNDPSAEGAADTDFLVVNASANRAVLDRWGNRFPTLLEPQLQVFATESRIWPPYPLNYGGSTPDSATGRASVNTDGPVAAFVGFESPMHHGRSVIALTATSPDAARSALDALTDGAKRKQIRGDAALVRGSRIDSFQLGTRYFVGDLPLWRLVSFHAARHPLLLAAAGIIGGILTAFLVYRGLQNAARARLGK